MTITPFCPRCGGSLRRTSDLYGEYDWCLNCGYHGDVLAGPPIELKRSKAGAPGGKRARQQRSRGPSRGGKKL